MASNRKWLILVSTGLMIMLVNLDMTIVNLALATIVKSMNATVNQMQWIITSYLLATALSFTIFGRLADIYGHKKIFLLGVSLFTIGSLFAGFSGSVPLLIFSRFVQGLGFAATLGLSFVIIFKNFPENQRGMAAGVAVTITGISQAIGPTVGGLIIQYLSWPWIFWVNVPIGLISLVATSLSVPKDDIKGIKGSISALNICFLVLGLGMILYTMNQLSQLSLSLVVICFMLGVIMLYLFVHSAKKKQNPLIKFSLLSHKGFSLLVSLRFLFMLLMSSSLFIIPLYLQNILNFTPEKTGIIMLGMTLFVALSSPITGALMDKYGFFKLVFTSILLALLASLSTFFLTTTRDFIPIFLALLFLGLAVGVHTPSSIAGVNKEVPGSDSGTAMGLFFTLAISGAITGVALAGTFLGTMSKWELINTVGIQHPSVALLQASSGTKNVHSLPDALQGYAMNAFMHSYHSFMFLISAAMIFALILAAVLVRYHNNTESLVEQT